MTVAAVIGEYRIHIVGVVCLCALIHYWRIGHLTTGSFWILGVTGATEIAIWAFFRHEFARFRDDPVRVDYEARRAALWKPKRRMG
jgi:hypothetical protein